MDTSTVIETVRGFLAQFISDTNIDSDLNYFEAGLLNSMFAMQLLLFVEEEFGIQVTNDDLDVKNFESLNAVGAFVTKKMSEDT